MIPSMYTAKSNWLESYKKINVLKKSNEAAICVVGGRLVLGIQSIYFIPFLVLNLIPLGVYPSTLVRCHVVCLSLCC